MEFLQIATAGGWELAKRQRILVVDDFADIRELWLIWLTMSGFIVAEAANGREAIGAARGGRPDLVVMDLSMPVMDGFEAIKQLRADASTAHVPIIAVTALGTQDAFERARQPGATMYVKKPVAPDELLRHIENTLATH